jgi:hypothetical protein
VAVRAVIDHFKSHFLADKNKSMMKTYALVVSLTMVSMLCMASPTMARTMMVTNLADAGQGSLRAAITSANENPNADTIRFPKHLAGTIVLTSGPIDITSELMIDGPGASRMTFSGNNTSRVFNLVPKSKLSLHNVTIADACNTRQDDLTTITVTRGGAILNDGGTLRLMRVTMRNNRTIDVEGSDVVGGGAVVNSGFATLVASHCLFVDNRASGGRRYAFGGAIGSVTDSFAMIENCTFIGNEVTSGGTSYGGAIGNFGRSQLDIIKCVFDDNSARGSDANEKAFGGAIATRPGTVDATGSMTEIDSCRFTGNRALSTAGEPDAGGGALYNERSMLLVGWSSFRRNEAVGGNASGGAIIATGLNDDEPFTEINRCDFSGNMVQGGIDGLAAGGALHNTFGLMSLTQTTIRHNLADGGDDGQGIGGGLYNLGTVTADQKTRRRIVDNTASTSFDDAFGLVIE